MQSSWAMRRWTFTGTPRRLPLAVAHLVLLVCALMSVGCEALIGADFDQRYVVGQQLDGGQLVAPPSCVPVSCESQGYACGDLVDECTGQTFHCGTCPAGRECEDNQCVCPSAGSCETEGVECGYRTDSCNRIEFCKFCQDQYPNDPSRAHCSSGQCGADPCQTGSCQELTDRGIAAECGTVAVCETSVECGGCSGRELCLENLCEGYNPLRCSEFTGGGLLCGTFPDGAGGEVSCGCGSGEVCAKGGVCCAPRTCPEGACGTLPDGCGGTIECGGCGNGESCLDNVCCDETPACPTNSCGQVMACGQVIDCECPEGSCCSTKDGISMCRQAGCPNDGTCGDNLDDGCGGTVDGCGCPDGFACEDGRCECVPRECPGDSCGYVSDGCGGQINCGCGGSDRCVDGECCTPQCPEGACGMVPDACGGLIDCTCADGEGCAEGLCVTPDCPDEATCGVVLTAGEALACRGDCEDGEPCELRDDGNYVCGDCSAECPENTACGLTDLDCTVLSCPGSCAVDGQRCINRNTGDGPDNYACCMPRCPAGGQATCGAYVDAACGDAPLSCPGACPNAGEVCVMVSAGEYGCRVPECPPNATCGLNTADTGHQIQCEGTCTGANAVCQRDGNNYSCTCQPNENPCQDQCGVTVDNGCGTMVSCTCGAGQVCNDGRCCRPETAAAACAREGAECGSVVDPVCGTESDCGACRTDQTCDFDARVCECNPAQCDMHESCGANEQCVCDNAKCPDGQACNASGVCACDSSQCPTGQACNSNGVCACDSSQCPAGQACNASGACACDSSQCPAGETCNASGVCACSQTNAQACSAAMATCGEVENSCGDDVPCGTCPTGSMCVANSCVCSQTNAQACDGATCGTVTNSCGQMVTCGTCMAGQTCVAGACCAPDADACDDAECGSVANGCGGMTNCGTCAAGETCTSGSCVCDTTEAEACANLECGTVMACGAAVDCGTCSNGEVCTAGACVCPDAATACTGRICGSVTVCGETISCGTCPTGTCSTDGTACITPPTDSGE